MQKSNVIGNLFIMVLNTLGTICWVFLYTSGTFTEWWAIGLIIVCALAALISGFKICQYINSKIHPKNNQPKSNQLKNYKET
jgi:hypothetical protein